MNKKFETELLDDTGNKKKHILPDTIKIDDVIFYKKGNDKEIIKDFEYGEYNVFNTYTQYDSSITYYICELEFDELKKYNKNSKLYLVYLAAEYVGSLDSRIINFLGAANYINSCKSGLIILHNNSSYDTISHEVTHLFDMFNSKNGKKYNIGYQSIQYRSKRNKSLHGINIDRKQKLREGFWHGIISNEFNYNEYNINDIVILLDQYTYLNMTTEKNAHLRAFYDELYTKTNSDKIYLSPVFIEKISPKSSYNMISTFSSRLIFILYFMKLLYKDICEERNIFSKGNNIDEICEYLKPFMYNNTKKNYNYVNPIDNIRNLFKDLIENFQKELKRYISIIKQFQKDYPDIELIGWKEINRW